jgi:hypothetical protein
LRPAYRIAAGNSIDRQLEPAAENQIWAGPGIDSVPKPMATTPCGPAATSSMAKPDRSAAVSTCRQDRPSGENQTAQGRDISRPAPHHRG